VTNGIGVIIPLISTPAINGKVPMLEKVIPFSDDFVGHLLIPILVRNRACEQLNGRL
jgi:hypothetical protein